MWAHTGRAPLRERESRAHASEREKMRAKAGGVRLLADGLECLVPHRSVHRRRLLATLQLAIELLMVHMCLCVAATRTILP